MAHLGLAASFIPHEVIGIASLLAFNLESSPEMSMLAMMFELTWQGLKNAHSPILLGPFYCQ